MITGLEGLLYKHLFSKAARPAVRWMNRFAILATALGLCAWLTTLNVMEGLQKQIRDEHLAAKAHLLLEGPLRSDLKEVASKVQEKLGPELKDIKIKLQFEGLVEPLREGKIFTGSGIVIEGDPSVASGSMVMGDELGFALHASSMEAFRLRNVWKLEGAPLELKLKGFKRSDLMDVDRFYVWVSEEDLEEWLGAQGLRSRIEIILKDPYKAPEFLSSLQKIDPAFKDWKQLDSALWHSLDLEKKAMAISLFFVVLFGSLAVSSALSLRIAEKRREIGLLRAMGASAQNVFWLFELEGLFLGTLGLLLGLVLSAAFTWAIGHWGVLPQFFYSQNLPVDWSWSRALLLFALSLLTVAMASFIPAKRLYSWDIATLLRS
jgi:lipoprotein-releasing system permease protein